MTEETTPDAKRPPRRRGPRRPHGSAPGEGGAAAAPVTPPLKGTAKAVLGDGLLIDLGAEGEAFMPGREVDMKPVADLPAWVGREVECRPMDPEPGATRRLVSRKAVLLEERARLRDRLFETLKPGQIVTGTVTNVTDFGAGVDIGGVEALVAKNDLAWAKIGHPSEVAKPGQEVKLSVLSVDRKARKVALGLKQAGPSPWDDAAARYVLGQRRKGRVVGVIDTGATLELEPGLMGFIPIAELNWSKRTKRASDVLRLNQEVEAEIIGLDVPKRKIVLSLKKLEPNPWAGIEARYPFAMLVDGVVTELAEFGAFVRLKDGLDALVHVSEITRTKHIRHPAEFLKVGQEVRAVVIGADEKRQRLSLSLRHIEPDPWWEVADRYPKGRTVGGAVTRLEPFGAFVRLEEGVDGLIHVSQMGRGRTEHPEDVVKAGDKVTVEVIEVDIERKRVRLRLVEG